uniref:Uncharacterized protein n=1 Tax=Panagrolaimus sp. PS1159 TaxID=55785 RepID=A0AC35F1J6_9BILA
MNGKPKITTLVPMSPVTNGETYYFIISTLDEFEVEINPSQMAPQSSNTHMSSQSPMIPMAHQSSITPVSSHSSMTPMSSQSSITPMGPPSPMTPHTAHQYQRIFSSTSTNATPMPSNTTEPEVRGFPGSQCSDFITATSNNTTPKRTTSSLPPIRRTFDSALNRAASAVVEVQNRPSLVEEQEEEAVIPVISRAGCGENDTARGNHETDASASASQSTDILPMGKGILQCPVNHVDGVNRGKLLGTIYSKNQQIMDTTFAAMTTTPFIFYDINIHERMRNPKTIAAFVLIAPTGMADYDIRVGQIARDVCQKFVVDLVMEVKKSNPITREIVRPLIRHLNEITQGNFFDYLITPDGPLLAAIRKREARQSISNGFPRAKKMKPMFPEVSMEDVERASNAAAAAQTQEDVAAIIKNSSAARCLWISKMVEDDKARIPELVVAKFPMFKTNGSWLQHDFAYTLENIYNFPMFNISKTLEKFAPAIAALACDYKILSAADQVHASTDLLRTTELLLQLLGIYFKKKGFIGSIDRLVVSSQGLPSVDEMIDRRRAIKQIAPMIFVVPTTHENDYFISTDDFALKVPGNFGDALHYLTALHYVLYIEYAKELLHFNMFLENLCGINMKKMPKSRLNLKFDLDNKMKNISQEPQ